MNALKGEVLPRIRLGLPESSIVTMVYKLIKLFSKFPEMKPRHPIKIPYCNRYSTRVNKISSVKAKAVICKNASFIVITEWNNLDS